MRLYDLLIINGIVVTDTEVVENDIAILDSKVKKLVARGSLAEGTAKRTIDAKGGYIMVVLLPSGYDFVPANNT
jgi:dihydropyrimidinase